MDTLTALLYAATILSGLLVGSFLNVCILRIPQGESIVTVPSHCPSCNKRLKWYELIPVVSWICLRGKCSGCKCPISAQYPLIEAANGILWATCAIFIGINLYLPLCLSVASALLALSVIDGRTQEIPLGFNVFILAVGALNLVRDWHSWPLYVIGLFAVSLPLFLIQLVTQGRGVGGGDVKLMAAAGLFLGWKLVVIAFFAGCVLASIIHLARMRFAKAGRQLALGPYLSAGLFAAMLWGDRLIGVYLGSFG